MAINFNQDRAGLLGIDTGINYDQMAFKSGSPLDRQINKLNELEQMGYPQPNLQKLKDMDMKQFQEKGIPLSLPSDNYTAMNLNNFNQIFSGVPYLNRMSDVNKNQFSIKDLQPKAFNNFYREALNKQGLLSLDDAGLTKEPYEEFTQVAKPGLNMDFVKQLGSSALGLITGNPFIGLLARGLGALAGRGGLPGVRGGADLRGDTGFDTFSRSTSLADFFERQRNKKAREDAAARGAEKQAIKDKRNFDKNFRGFFSGQNEGGSKDHDGGASAGAQSDAAAGMGGY